MNLKILTSSKLSFLHFAILLIFFFSTANANAQCAGNDNSITVCGDDLPDSSNQSINLFSLLGVYTTGGTWTDNLLSGGLNPSTGILNAQNIKNSGVYTYTYTVDNVGCKDSATITVTIGGYAGIPAPTSSACSDDSAFNLFQVFDGTNVSPHSNGIWTDDTGALMASMFDAGSVALGTHHFTYTMPAIIRMGIEICPTRSSTVTVTVYRAAEPGTPVPLQRCSSDLPLYTNLDLNSRLIGADPGGIWTEDRTSELSGPLDSTINLQNIYNTMGPGLHSFTYTVTPTKAVCNIKKSIVNIFIEKQLDFTGATFDVRDYFCGNIRTDTVTADLFQGIQNIPDGAYDVTYTISGVASSITVTEVFINGKMQLPIPSSNFLQDGSYTIAITNIARKGDLGICTPIIGTLSDVLKIVPIPKINTATLTINPVCKGSSATVGISGNTNLTDGNYSILYNLSDKNTAVGQQAFFTVSGGTATFLVPSSLIPIDGNTTISITSITNLTTGCTNTATPTQVFVVKPLTDLANLKIDIKDVCQNQPVTVSLTGLGALTNITLNYNLTGVNSAMNQTVIVPVSSGNASFIIPVGSLVNTGSTSLVITDIIDNTGGCRSSIPNNPESFAMNGIPSIPITNNPNFCKNDKKTIADLTPSGTQYQWFDSATSTTVLSANTLLVSRTYYVKEVNVTTGCESGRAPSIVVIDEVQAPTLNQDGQNFCGLDNPTLQNLTANATTNGTLTWFDAPTNGNQIVSTDLLKDGFTYYGFDYSSSTNCYSDALAVTVSLSNCDVTPGFFIPDGFSPNGDAVNDTFKIPDIEFIYPNYSLEVFNRYGNLMFSGNKNKPEWDGRNSDSKIGIDGFAPNGVYFYVINYNKGNKSPKQGRLYLNR
ncbi:gliding motility-associated C-terminal domain-containing protein [Flavobacterium rhamnosiphilum]|uniref:Gliding motility-associated C-terminal domain-containing protein n=1 Tax=Flavobacterium rhamnosiphilum TaxID=2541724 RepID=A0A4R5F4A1_9FLAO|nr:gliding motility-associated C-terminal domain-containing protein [Flavobacterium rhamnosiphilum]TDE42424.1 gliding motility-associated C-terminal domain-containing protein [Flavobacterium rhamnosiphilum]